MPKHEYIEITKLSDFASSEILQKNGKYFDIFQKFGYRPIFFNVL